MKLLFALTSLAALTSALMTSADKKGKDKLKGKKQIKVTADVSISDLSGTSSSTSL